MTYIYLRVISRTSDVFGEASFDVEFGVDLNNIGLALVRHGLRQLDPNEIFVQNRLKIDFQHFFFAWVSFFFLSRRVTI